MRAAKFLVISIILIFLISFMGMSFVSAAFAVTKDAVYINRTVNNQINFSITAESGSNANISEVKITFSGIGAMGMSFSSDSNATTAAMDGEGFSTDNLPMGQGLVLTWNLSESGFGADSTHNFTAGLNPRMAGSVNVLVNITRLDGEYNDTTIKLVSNFEFSGYIKNETGGFQENANVSMYQMNFGLNGALNEALESSVLTNSNGHFDFGWLNGSSEMYKIKILYFENQTAQTNISKISSSLPDFPKEIFYTMPSPPGMPVFMRPPSLNGTTFYLEPAAMLRITAKNETDSQRFGYEVMSQSNGFPIESGFQSSVLQKDVYVPLNRDYTVMVLRDPSAFGFSPLCDGDFMNDSLCPTPPKSVSSISPTTAGEIIDIQFNLTTNEYQLYGCIDVTGNETNVTNITSIMPKLLPWEGFVPPVKADDGGINLIDIEQLNYGDARCPGELAWYNISLIDGTYLIEMYGANGSEDDSGYYVGAFQNLTFNNHTEFNITLRPLYGNYAAEGDVNTSKIKFNIVNSSGAAVTQDTPHVELYFKHSTYGELHYIVNSLTNGVFYAPMIEGATGSIRLFPNQAPPIEKTLNLSNASINIEIITMQGGDAGMRKVNASGQIEEMNVTDIPMKMRFLRNTGSCNVLDAPESCVVTSMNATDFNPLQALVAGRINMEMTLISSGVRILFYNFDMFSAKQPPMNSIMNDNSSSSSSSSGLLEEVWEFGSFAPSNVYDYAVIRIPYIDTVVDDSADINLSIPMLYDEDWNVIWNKTRGDTDLNLSDEYIDYNNTDLYRDFLSEAGVNCNKTSNDLSVNPCYINTTSNYLFMKIPHFSGVAPSISASVPSSGDGGDGNNNVVGGGGGGGSSNKYKKQTWTRISAGAATVMKNFDWSIGIKQIEVKVQNEAQNVEIKVTKYEDKPASINVNKTGKVYNYLQINEQNLENKLERAVLTIRIEREWLTENGLTRNDAALYKLDEVNGKWNEIPLENAGEDTLYHYYNASLNSFSYFLIGEKTQEVAEDVSDTTETETQQTDEQTQEQDAEQQEQEEIQGESSFVWIWILIIIGITAVIFVVSVVIYRKMHR